MEFNQGMPLSDQVLWAMKQSREEFGTADGDLEAVAMPTELATQVFMALRQTEHAPGEPTVLEDMVRELFRFIDESSKDPDNADDAAEYHAKIHLIRAALPVRT